MKRPNPDAFPPPPRNLHETSLREVKANKLADAVISEYREFVGGTDPELLESIEANELTEEWDHFATMAEVSPPSETTIDLTYAIIRRSLSTKSPIDPFEGI